MGNIQRENSGSCLWLWHEDLITDAVSRMRRAVMIMRRKTERHTVLTAKKTWLRLVAFATDINLKQDLSDR